MKKNLFYFLTAALLLFIQAHPNLPFGRTGIRPDLLFILAVYAGVCARALSGAFICFLLGYAAELFSGATSGFYSTIYLSVFLSIRIFLKYFSFDTIAKLIILLFVCFFIKFFILFFSFYFIYEYSYSLIKKVFFLESFYTLVLSPFVFFLLLKIESYKKEVPYFFGSKKHVS